MSRSSAAMPARRRSRLLHALASALSGRAAPGRGDHLLVGVSGGPDSTALLAALAALAPAQGWRLTAAHVAHGLRGAESEDDRRRVAGLAQRLAVAHDERQAPVEAGPGLEARARRARHRALVAMATAGGARWIVLGHTADDQAETVLLHLLRGAGRRGLGGMRPRRGRVLRPLLGARRSDVLRFLAEEGLAAGLDRSNADLHHARNRVRRLVLPLLQAELNPALVPGLVAMAERLRDEDAVLDALASERLATIRRGDDIPAAALAAEPLGLARRIVRRWLETAHPRGPAAVHVERVLALARGARRGVVAVPGPARVLRTADRLVRRPGREGAGTPFAAALGPGAVVFHPAGWRLALGSARERGPDETRPPDAAHALFDADRLTGPLRVRSPQAGDRIHLPGVGTRKLQDVLVDARVAREDRLGVPVVEAAGTVLWVAGIARASGAMLDAETRRVVAAALERRDRDARCPP